MFKVALLQLQSAEKDQSRWKGEVFCRRAKDMGADIALFPEMWNIGYSTCPTDEAGRKSWQAQAIAKDDGFVVHFRKLAKELDMAIALTYLEKVTNGAPRNSVSIIDRTGNILMTYAKVHTCDFGMEAACTPGHDFYICDLNTASDTVKIGAMICYDREFPESARILMLKGAEIILVPNACDLEILRIGQIQARAFENMVGIAVTNYAHPKNNGHSIAFDGVAFEKPDDISNDMLLIQAGQSEGIYMADFDMERIRAYRERETWGNAYRKPYAYGDLLSEAVEKSFIRPDSRRKD